MTEPLKVNKLSNLAEAAELRKIAARITKAVEKLPQYEPLPEWEEIIQETLEMADRLEGNDQIVDG